MMLSIVRVNVRNTAKNVKSHDFLDFEKRKKRKKNPYRSNDVHREDHGDHPQSVLLSFAQ